MRTRITTQKWGDDDAYSWAVLRNGRPIITGLSKTEAAYHKRKIAELFEEREGK